jgi:outer membrane protein assembly factor BamB
MADGSMIWRLIVPQGGYGPGTYGVCGTPVVDGDRIYVMAMWEVFCLDLDGLADGNDGMQDELAIMTREPFDLPEGTEKPTQLPDWSADVIWHFSLRPFDIKVQDATSCSPVKVGNQLWISTANEIGHRARRYNAQKNPPHLIVLDTETGKLIARDRMSVPIVFHGEWSSPSLIEVNGEKAVLFPDGYGVLHAFAIPKPGPDGSEATLEELWSMDLNPPENRRLPDGREMVYTVDRRLRYKYPEGYYTDLEKFFMYNEGKVPEPSKHWCGFDPAIKRLADGDHPTVTGPCEIISMPAVKGNRIYLGIGRDRAYGLGRARGRFVCLEVEDIRGKPRLVWEDREIGRTQCTASIADGLVYVADGLGKLNCYNAETGKVIYRFELDRHGIKERSQMVVDGKIYVGTRGRAMKVLKAGPKPELLAENRLSGEAATVEAADGLLMIQTHRELLLYGNEPKTD